MQSCLTSCNLCCNSAQRPGVRIEMDPCPPSCAHLLSLLFKTHCNCAFKQQDMQAFTSSRLLKLALKLALALPWYKKCDIFTVLRFSSISFVFSISQLCILAFLLSERIWAICGRHLAHELCTEDIFSSGHYSCSSSDSYLPFSFYKTIETL